MSVDAGCYAACWYRIIYSESQICSLTIGVAQLDGCWWQLSASGIIALMLISTAMEIAYQFNGDSKGALGALIAPRSDTSS